MIFVSHSQHFLLYAYLRQATDFSKRSTFCKKRALPKDLVDEDTITPHTLDYRTFPDVRGMPPFKYDSIERHRQAVYYSMNKAGDYVSIKCYFTPLPSSSALFSIQTSVCVVPTIRQPQYSTLSNYVRPSVLSN